MAGLFLLVLPIFGLIALGYGARLTRVLSDRTGDGLADFVFTLAVPCLIFSTLARVDFPLLQPWGYWIAYFTGAAIVWIAATQLQRRVFGGSPRLGVVAGFAAGQSNTVFVGVPIILQAYGEAGAVPLFMLLAVHLPIMMTIATLLAEGREASLLGIAGRLLRHPIIIGILAGSAARVLPIGTLPEPLWKIVDLVANAAVPCALVALGIALGRHGLSAAGWRMPIIISALKLLIHPLIVFLLVTTVFSMPSEWAGVAVLFAACPSGINAYLFAERYQEGISLASSAVALSTIMGLFTTVLWLRVLGVG